MLRRAVTESRAHGDEHALLAAAFAGLPDAIVVADLDEPGPARQPGRGGAPRRARERRPGPQLVDTLILQPSARAVARESVRKITARTLDSVTIPARMVRDDGTDLRAEVAVSALRSPGGEAIGVISVVRDVTARVAAEADVATLRAIVYAAEEAIIGVDRAGAILFFSPSAERLYGWRADEVIGQPVSLLIADHEQHLLPEVVDALLAGETVRREGVARRRDGTHVEAELNASPITGPGRPHAGHGPDRARHLRTPARASGCSSASWSTRRT